MFETFDGGGSEQSPASPVVLLVEDEIFIRIASAEWLRDEGFVVIEAANGPEALAILRSGREIDLLATDITMPGEPDGLELASIARKIHPGLPILLVSARLPEAGAPAADRLLAKPYQLPELVSTIQEMIEPSWRNRTENRNAS